MTKSYKSMEKKAHKKPMSKANKMHEAKETPAKKKMEKKISKWS